MIIMDGAVVQLPSHSARDAVSILTSGTDCAEFECSPSDHVTLECRLATMLAALQQFLNVQ